MKIIECNLCGKKHSNKGSHCEDSVFVSEKNGVFTVAVADGAGSNNYPHAKQGADAVTKAVCEFLCERFDDFYNAVNELEVKKVIVAVCQKALKSEAEKLSLTSTETMASTLLCVSIKGGKLIACHIGDGVIGKITNGFPEAITRPQNGEFASSTYFINSPEAYQIIQIKRTYVYSSSHFFLMTDGISDYVFNDFTGEFKTAINELAEYTESDNGSELLKESILKHIVDTDEHSDDSTIAIIKTDNPCNWLKADTHSHNNTEKVFSDTEPTEIINKPKSDKKIIIALSAALIVVFSILIVVLFIKQSPESGLNNTTTSSALYDNSASYSETESFVATSGMSTAEAKDFSEQAVDILTGKNDLSEILSETEKIIQN